MTATTKFNGIELAKTVSKFKREILNPKLNELKGINYKTAFKLFAQINEIVGTEIVKFEAVKGTLHTYKVSNRLRYNDSYKQGYYIKVTFLNEKYEAHTKDTYASYNFANWINDTFGDVFELAKNIRENV